MGIPLLQTKVFITVVDPEGVISFASPLASAAFGITPEDAVGRCIFPYVDRADLDRVLVRHALTLNLDPPKNALNEHQMG